MSEQPSPLAALFDLDGTLVDSMPSIARAMKETLAEFGYLVSTDAIMPLIGAPMESVVTKLTGVAESTANQIYERYLTVYYDDMIQTTQPFASAEKLLERLHDAGIPLAVVTNKSEHGGKLMVKIQGWEKYFNVIVGRDSAARPKPWPDGVLHALGAFRVPPQRSAIVGDTEFDMQAGREALLHYRIGITGSRTVDELSKAGATHIIDDLEAVGDILLTGQHEQGHNRVY